MSTGVFPDHMELAMLSPVYNGGSKLGISNYQPVSVLLIQRKVLEKIVQVRLITFQNTHNIIHSNRYGFQENKSTTLAIFDLYSKIIKAFDNDDYACNIFLSLLILLSY